MAHLGEGMEDVVHASFNLVAFYIILMHTHAHKLKMVF